MDKWESKNSDALVLESIKIQFSNEAAENSAKKLQEYIGKELQINTLPPEMYSDNIAQLGVGEILINIILAPFLHQAVIAILNKLKRFFKAQGNTIHGGQIIIQDSLNQSGRRFPFTYETDIDELYIVIEKFINKRSESLLERIEANINEGEEIRTLLKQEATFLFSDVVGSKKLGEDEPDLLVSAYSFEQFYKYTDRVVEKNRGKVLNAVRDNVIAWFDVPDNAVNCASELFSGRDEFNRKKNKMKNPFQFRVGIDTGPALIDESKGSAFSRGVLELAELLQKEAEPGIFLISEYTYNRLENKNEYHKYKYIPQESVQSYTSKSFPPYKNGNNNQQPIEQIPVKKILIVSANPNDMRQLQLDEEFQEIEVWLERAKYRNHFQVKSCLAVTYDNLRHQLLTYAPHIVHFACHGDEEGLIVKDELGLAEPISSKVLSELFALCAHHVECVLLNACYTASQAVAINKHIKNVIGMKKEIEDKAAVKFAIGFYDALGAGRSVEDAFKFGRTGILHQFPDIDEYLIPVLETMPPPITIG
jgi:class 3 adenylate cyclase